MAEQTGPGRDPDAELRTRRFIDYVNRLVGDLVRGGAWTINENDEWVPNPGAAEPVIAAAVFGQKVFLPPVPQSRDARPVLAARVFAQRVSYGTVG